MPNDINELDVNDIGLKGIFGDRFHDETQPEKVISKKENTTTPNVEKSAQKVTHKFRDAEWESIPHEPTQTDKLKSCAKWVLSLGGLNLLIFYWQMAELMAESIAVPCMWICCAMAGYGVGASIWRGRK